MAPDFFVLQGATISDLSGQGHGLYSQHVDNKKILKRMQHTISKPVMIEGVGLHSGALVRMRIAPAPADHGIIFVRTDLPEARNIIRARFDKVSDTRLCTVIQNVHGASVGTIEHLMAALRGCGIDNVRIDIDAPEVPIMDGSAKPFVDLFDQTGLVRQSAPRRAIKILKEVIVRDGDKMVRLAPSSIPVFTGKIDFGHSSIRTQEYTLKLLNGNFRHDVADCRTFGFLNEVKALQAVGLARGGSLDNAIVLDEEGILNPEGLRCTDEFARHKVLDAVGDLYLAGGPILGAYDGYKAGHALNNAILHAVFADSTAWMPVDLYQDDFIESESLLAEENIILPRRAASH